MYNKTSFKNLTDYADLVGLCGIGPIMRKIMRAHNRIIPPSLLYGPSGSQFQRQEQYSAILMLPTANPGYAPAIMQSVNCN